LRAGVGWGPRSVTAALAVSFAVFASLASVSVSAFVTFSRAISVATVTTVTVTVTVSAAIVSRLVTIVFATAGPLFAESITADTASKVAGLRKCLAVNRLVLFDRVHSF
jgi:hypothetical protein